MKDVRKCIWQMEGSPNPAVVRNQPTRSKDTIKGHTCFTCESHVYAIVFYLYGSNKQRHARHEIDRISVLPYSEGQGGNEERETSWRIYFDGQCLSDDGGRYHASTSM